MNRSTDVTQDVCPFDFPPAVYGRTLAEIEATVQETIERLFRDEDGILRSSVNARTMKPYQIEDVKDRPNGIGAFTEHSAIPAKAKPVWMNYENAGQASGVYLDGLCAKFRATGDKAAAGLAARTVQAIGILWDNAAEMPYPNGGAGRGWFPKPYLGIRNLAEMYECSADQYCDITLGLHSHYLTLATEDEKRRIERIITSFADWWNDHDYAGIYFGKPIWWKRLDDHPMAAGFFLYLNALAYSWNPCRKYRHGFETWLEIKDALTAPADPIWVCLNGVTLKCLERLISLRPEMADYWRQAAAHQAALLAVGLDAPKGLNKTYETNALGANYLSTAHRLMPEAGYDAYVRRCLENCTKRSRFYHLRRDEPLANLSPRESGDDFRDALQCECHVHWLAAYWASPYLHTGSSRR